MRKAVFLTAYNRITYLQQTLHTWRNVRGQEDWDFVASIEPSEITQQIVDEFTEFEKDTRFANFTVIINPNVAGVLHHPWLRFEDLLSVDEYDFVVRAEDDLIVSDDILEFFSWSAQNFQGDDSVATVHAFTHEDGPAEEVRLSEGFSPWLWGTWRNRWVALLGPTWDHNYSTFNGFPGNQSGWDWNLNTRIFPEYDLRSVTPKVSRANNIGYYGTHATPANFDQADAFREHRDPVQFKMGR